jgi:hypothetical protein
MLRLKKCSIPSSENGLSVNVTTMRLGSISFYRVEKGEFSELFENHSK